MKQAILLFFLLSCNQALGQFFKKNALYGSTSLTVGNYLGIDANLNLLINKEYSLQVGWLETIRNARNTPEDYSGGLVTIITIGSLLPYDFLRNFYLNGGKTIYLNHSRNLRFNLLAGVSYTKIKEPTNWVSTSTGFIGPNYEFSYESNSVFSLNLNPRFEFVPIDYFGIGLSPLIILNGNSNYAGIGISLMAGLVR